MKSIIVDKNTKKIGLCLIIATLLLSVALFTYLYTRPICNYSFSIVDATPEIGRMELDGYYFDENHSEELADEEQKIFFNIPQQVNRGSYTLRVGYRSGSPSYIAVGSESNPNAVKCERMALTHLPDELPGEFNMNYGLGFLPGYMTSEMFITEDVSDLDVFVMYGGFQYFYIESVELIGNRTYIKTIFPVAILVMLFIDCLILVVYLLAFGTDNNIEICKSNCIKVLLIILITVIASIPLFRNIGIQFDDGHFLYAKINGIMDGLRDGQFPVRIHPNTLRKYGYGLPYFYPELFLYPFGILRCIGYSLRFCLYAMIFCLNLGTAFISYWSVKKVYHSSKVAFVGSFLYTLSLYRLVDIYSRGAIAEVIAIMFLPLIVTGIYVILKDEGGIVPLCLGLFGILNSHILTCEMVAIFVVLICIIFHRTIFSKEHFISLSKSVVIAILLSMYFIGPFVYMSTIDAYKVYQSNAYNTSDSCISLQDILAITCSSVGESNTGAMLDVRYTLGAVIVLLAIVLFVYMLVIDRCQKKNRLIMTCFLLGTVAMLMSTSMFPWEAIENAGGLIRTVMCMVQFPWRFLSIAMVLYMFSICGCLKIIMNHDEIKKKNICKCVVVSLFMFIFLLQVLYYFTTVSLSANEKHKIYNGSFLRRYNCTGMGEYEPVNFDNESLDYSIEELQYALNYSACINPTGEDGNSGITISQYTKQGTKSSLLIINPTGEEQILYLPITYYKGYEANNMVEDPEGKEVELFESEYGIVTLRIPEGYYNGVSVTYREPILFRTFELLTLLTLVLMSVNAIYIIIKVNRKQHMG